MSDQAQLSGTENASTPSSELNDSMDQWIVSPLVNKYPNKRESAPKWSIDHDMQDTQESGYCRLMKHLEDVKEAKEIIELAKKGDFSDFGSNIGGNSVCLYNMLTDIGRHDLAKNVTTGEYEHDYVWFIGDK